jgi:hypothetical protein
MPKTRNQEKAEAAATATMKTAPTPLTGNTTAMPNEDAPPAAANSTSVLNHPNINGPSSLKRRAVTSKSIPSQDQYQSEYDYDDKLRCGTERANSNKEKGPLKDLAAKRLKTAAMSPAGSSDPRHEEMQSANFLSAHGGHLATALSGLPPGDTLPYPQGFRSIQNSSLEVRILP